MKVAKKTALIVLLLVFGGGCLFMSMRSGAPWSAALKMANGTQTLTVLREREVYYTVTLPETSGASGTYPLKPRAVVAPGWTETFLDDSPRLPGRWTMQSGANEIDIMENTIRVNKAAHPKGSTIILK